MCYSVDHARGLRAIGGLRLIPKTERDNPTTQPTSPSAIGQDIRSNPSSTAVFVIIRSNGGQPGLLYTWPVGKGGEVSTTPVVTSLPQLPFLFSIIFLGSDRRLSATNPVQGDAGASFLELSPSLKVRVEKAIPVADQFALCWGNYAPRFNSAYVNAGLPRVMVLDSVTGAVRGTVTHGDRFGGTDKSIDRRWLYHLVENFDGWFTY